MKSPFFSIVIPTYNRAHSIVTTLRSVKDQTFQDFECLIIDDGSKDGEALKLVVQGFDDDRFKYIRQENNGASSARNRGFDMAQGAFIALLDSDDTFLPEKLALQADILRDDPNNHLVFSRLMVDKGEKKTWIKPPRGPKPDERIDEYLMCTHGWIQSSTMVLSTELARTVRFDENLPSSQDTDFAIRCASAGAKFTYIEQPLIILEDVYTPNRVSKQAKYKPLLEWINGMRGKHVSEKAYWAYRGWQVARVASFSNRPYAIWLYLQSAIRGVYSLKHTVLVGAQVAIPQSLYQKIATLIVRFLGKKQDA